MANPDEKKSRELLKPIYINNIPCPNAPHFQVEKMKAALDYMPRDGDIIICSYPKTGTTWMQYIVWKILHKGEPLPSLQDMEFKYSPFMELSGIEAVEALSSPRYYKTHFPYNALKINEKAKYIYIHRNPMDALVSFSHYINHVVGSTVPFDDFFEGFMSEEISYGDFFDHVLSYDMHRDNPNLQIFSYEDLHRDKREQVLRLAKFLGDEYYQAVFEDEAYLKRIMDETNFTYMKQNLDTNMLMGGDNMDEPVHVNMFRKGVIGDGKRELSSEQVNRFRQKMLAKMKDTKYVQLWS